MKKVLLTIAALSLMASAASADILWDQSSIPATYDSYMDSYSIGPWGDVIVYGASDFNLVVDATITSITTFYTNGGEWAPGTYDALLDVFVKTGPTPITGTDDPLATGMTVPVTLTDMGDGTLALTATGLSLALTAGDYWVMLSPTVPDGPGFREFHIMTDAAWGDPSAMIEFGGWMAPSWSSRNGDGTLVIEGDVTVPTEDTTWGQFRAIYR